MREEDNAHLEKGEWGRGIDKQNMVGLCVFFLLFRFPVLFSHAIHWFFLLLFFVSLSPFYPTPISASVPSLSAFLSWCCCLPRLFFLSPSSLRLLCYPAFLFLSVLLLFSIGILIPFSSFFLFPFFPALLFYLVLFFRLLFVFVSLLACSFFSCSSSWTSHLDQCFFLFFGADESKCTKAQQACLVSYNKSVAIHNAANDTIRLKHSWFHSSIHPFNNHPYAAIRRDMDKLSVLHKDIFSHATNHNDMAAKQMQRKETKKDKKSQKNELSGEQSWLYAPLLVWLLLLKDDWSHGSMW